jgi:acetyltransferase-like isoleucine patch superfamily enzyme
MKRAAQAIALAIVFPSALGAAFGRVLPVYTFFAHFYALVPGAVGNRLRSAFYKLTLRECSIDTNFAFGTFFAHPGASVGDCVAIGSYCVIGNARIGAHTQIASHVEIPSGRYQHARDSQGRLLGSVHGETAIGSHCWIGASAVILAEVGDGSTIGAGSVVVHAIPAGVVAAGNPARVIRPVSAGS